MCAPATKLVKYILVFSECFVWTIMWSLFLFAVFALTCESRNCSIWSAQYRLIETIRYPTNIQVYGVDLYRPDTKCDVNDKLKAYIPSSVPASTQSGSNRRLLWGWENLIPGYAVYSAGSSIVKSMTDSNSGSSPLWTTQLNQVPGVTRTEVVEMLQPIYDTLKNNALILDQLRRASTTITESVSNIGISNSKLTSLIFNDKTYNSPEAQEIRRHRQLNDVFSKADKPSNFKFMLEKQPKDPKNQFFEYQWIAYQMVRADNMLDKPQKFTDLFGYDNSLCDDPVHVQSFRYDNLCNSQAYPDPIERDNCRKSTPKYYRWTFKRTCELDIVDVSNLPNDWQSIPGCIDDILQEEVVFTSQVSNIKFITVNDPRLSNLYSDYRYYTFCPYMHFDFYNVVPHYAVICVLLLEQLINISGYEESILDGMSKTSFRTVMNWKSIMDVITMHGSTPTLRQREIGYRSQFFVAPGTPIYPGLRESKGITASEVVPSFGINIEIGIGTCASYVSDVGFNQFLPSYGSKTAYNIYPQIAISLADFTSQLSHFKSSLISDHTTLSMRNQLTPLLSPTWKQKDDCFPESRFATGIHSTSMYKVRIMQLVSEPGGIYGTSLYVYPKRLPEMIGVIVDENTNKIKGFLDTEYVSVNNYESILNLNCNCEAECSCLPKYHGMPADRLIDLEAFTVSSAQCGEACRAFINATFSIKEGVSEDSTNTTFCVELPQTAIRIDPLPMPITDVCANGPYFCRTSNGVIYGVPSCTGCLSCYKDGVLCDVTLTTLVDQSFVVSVTESKINNYSLSILEDLESVKKDIQSAVTNARSTQEDLLRTGNAIAALTVDIQNIRNVTLEIANNQSRAAIARISRTISDRVDVWGTNLANVCAAECGNQGVSFGIFAALWDATGAFGEVMKAITGDITTIVSLFSIAYFPYLFYVRYKEFQAQFTEAIADQSISTAVDLDETPDDQPLTASQSRSNQTTYIPRRTQFKHQRTRIM